MTVPAFSFDPGAPPDGSQSDTFYDDVVLQEPVMHAVTGAPLPTDHWLLSHWAGDESLEGDIVPCEQCGLPMYDRANNVTVETWVETGRIAYEHGEEAAQSWCLECFATSSIVWPSMNEWFALHDGGPIPVFELVDPVPRDQIAPVVYAVVAEKIATEQAPPPNDPSGELTVETDDGGADL
jgi:hypothetical protein